MGTAVRFFAFSPHLQQPVSLVQLTAPVTAGAYDFGLCTRPRDADLGAGLRDANGTALRIAAPATL
jgi:hypothetical protein